MRLTQKIVRHVICVSMVFFLTSYVQADILTYAANGLAIRNPTDKTTYLVQDGGQTYAIPEGMAYIPGGSFAYGTGATAETRTIGGYAIGKFSVTNAEYKAFLDATGSNQFPPYWSGGTYPAGKANHPVLFVSLNRATEYAAWVSQQTGWDVHIPSSNEWEKAARGPSGTLYPWGNTPGNSYNSTTGVLTTRYNYNANVVSHYLFNTPDLAVTYNDPLSTHYNQAGVTVRTIAAYDTADTATVLSISATGSVRGFVNHDTRTGFIYTDLFDQINAAGGYTTPAGSFENGKSAYGVYDMAGNVWNFTSTLSIATNGAEAGQLVNEVRGGSWYANPTSAQSVCIGEGRRATGAYNTIGFRVAFTPFAIPEPNCLTLILLTGVTGLVMARRRISSLAVER